MTHHPIKRSAEDTACLLNRYLLPTITICVGTFLSILGFVLMLNLGIERLQEEFNAASRLRVQTFSHWLEARIADVASVHRVYAASENVTYDEFMEATADLIAPEKIASFAWRAY